MYHARYTIIISLLCMPLLFFAQSVQKRAKGEIIVRFQDSSAATFFANKSQTYPIHLQKTISDTYSICLFGLDETEYDAEQTLEWLRAQKEVTYAQFNYWADLRDTTPDDTHYQEQWTLATIDAPDVWEVSKGGTTLDGDTIVVGVIDKGFDHLHEDLYDNVWINQAEIPNDGIDNDENGYIDDYYGWNFRWNTDNHKQEPNYESNIAHGTGVAGIIAAKGNNDLGVSGINWNSKMLLLTVIGYESEIIEAYLYMLELRKKYNASQGKEGAFIVASSISLGIPYAMAAEHPLWCEVYDLLGEAGILNIAATDNANYNVDTNGDMPTTCSSPYLLAVTNTNQLDQKEPNAAWGMESIDLGAPGTPSFTTRPNDSYGNMTGTSAATPHVAGSVALLYALPCEKLLKKAQQFPNEMTLMMKDFVLNSTTPLNSLKEKTTSGGRLDVGQAAANIRLFCGEAAKPLAIEVQPNLVANSDVALQVFYDVPDEEPYYLKVYSSDGKRFYEEKIQAPLFAERQHVLNLTALAPGLYIIALESKNGQRETTKLMVCGD